MQLPLQITFRHMDASEWIEEMIIDKAIKLNEFAGRLTSCRVVVQPAGKHHRHGNLYAIGIDITLPGQEIVVSRDPGEHREYKTLSVAISDAFDSARRQIKNYVQRIRHQVKIHEALTHARVREINPLEGFGFLRTDDGHDVYFRRSGVLNDAFDTLDIDSEVTFRELQGNKGPQASMIRRIGKQRHV